jgi:uncharacterized protein YutE (UPF0331/DUF86 family)
MNLNRDVLIAKLGPLHDAIDRIETKRPPSLELLLADRDLQDIVCKNIERAVQICIEIATHLATMNALAPKTSGESFKMLADKGMLDTELATAMIKAVGFRNVSVHDYVKVDWTIVMKIAGDGVHDLKAFGRWVKGLLPDAAPPPPGRR